MKKMEVSLVEVCLQCLCNFQMEVSEYVGLKLERGI